MICIKKSAKREKSDEYSVYTVMFLTYSSPQVGKKSFVGEFFYTGGTFGIKDPANVSEIFEFFCVIFFTYRVRAHPGSPVYFRCIPVIFSL
jgi:hypothetical protein